MTLPVKICRAASASVIRGPASNRGRESPLYFLLEKKWLKLKKIKILKPLEDTFDFGESSASSESTKTTSLMKTNNS